MCACNGALCFLCLLSINIWEGQALDEGYLRDMKVASKEPTQSSGHVLKMVELLAVNPLSEQLQ